MLFDLFKKKFIADPRILTRTCSRGLILIFWHGFGFAKRTDYAVLRARFGDRLGIPAVRGVPMVLIGTNG